MKDYQRLNFEDYFTICSRNYNKIETDLELAEYKSIPYCYKKKWFSADYQVRYDKERDCVQAIFQCTDDDSDWDVNLDFPHKIYDKIAHGNRIIQLRVHGGWGAMWLAMQDSVRKELKRLLARHPGRPVEVFGWSLGSAMAMLAAEDIYFKFGVKPYLYTFGSVKPFYGKQTYEYVRDCCEKAYNFYDHCDVVGYMVPFPGWRAINRVKLKLEPHFCITKLFNPLRFHTQYHTPRLYDGIE